MNTTTNTFVKQFKAARRVSTPLISVKTPDQAMTIETIKGSLTNGAAAPLLLWDCVRGCHWANDAGLEVAWRAIMKKVTGAPPRGATEQETFRQELGRSTV